jgi:hypothetical protein
MGWAQGFKLGSDMARNWIDTYEESKQQKALSDISKAKPEESMGYTAEQGQQLEALAGAINPETGQPYYQIEAIPGSNQYRVTPNFAGSAEQGPPQQVVPIDFAPQQVTDYLGRRSAGAMTQEQQEGARYRAMADVIAERNPIEGARLRMALSQEERSAKEFEQSSEIRGFQLGELKIKASQRDKFMSFMGDMDSNMAKIGNFVNSGDGQSLVDMAKGFGVDARMTKNKDGTVTYSVYENGKAVRSTTSISEAGAIAQEAFTENMLTKGIRMFSTTPEELISGLKAAHDMQSSRRRSLREEELFPLQKGEIEARTGKLKAEASALGPTASRDQTRLDIAQADLFRKQLSDIDAQLANYPDTSPQYKALAAQRNQVSAALRDINKSILGNRPASAIPTNPEDIPGYKEARAQALTGKREDGKDFTEKDRRDFREIYGVDMPPPKKGAKGPVPEKATKAPDKRENIFFNRATPRGIVEEAAAAGNPKAQAELKRRRSVEAAREAIPLNSGFQP